MNKEDFKKVIEETFEQIRTLTATKGEEYARSSDQLANFRRSAEEAGIEPEQVWIVFFNKHIDAIKTFAKGQARHTPSEPIEGRIDDAILYLILYKAMVREAVSAYDHVPPPPPKTNFEPFARCTTPYQCRNFGHCCNGSEFCD